MAKRKIAYCDVSEVFKLRRQTVEIDSVRRSNSVAARWKDQVEKGDSG
jgi:hypothetical protein